MNKFDLISDLLSYSGVKILGVTETWLTADLCSSFLVIPGYDVVRGDSRSGIRKHGSLLLVHESIKWSAIEVGVPNVAVVHLIDLQVFIAVCYRPPSYSELENACLVNFLSNFCLGKEVVVVGDFNLPTLNWQNGIPTGYIRPLDLLFLDTFLSLGLVQWIEEPTVVSSANTLDLVLTSEEDRISSVHVLPPFPRCIHSPVIVDYTFSDYNALGRGEEERRSWQRGKYHKIAQSISAVDWDFEFQYETVEENYNYMLSVLDHLVERYVPMRRIDVDPPWKMKPPRELIRQRQSAWHEYKEARSLYGRNDDRSQHLLTMFHQLNIRYRNFSTTSRATYEEELIHRQDSRKLFHAYIRNKKVGRPKVGLLRLPDGEMVVDSRAMSNIFAESFSSVFVAAAPLDPEPFQQFGGQLSAVDFSREQVEAVLLSLDKTSSMGPDGVHPCLLKECAHELSVPLSRIFAKSFRRGVVPSIWSQSNVVPIFKAKCHANPLNYRPVSLTSTCCKVMEKIVAAQLMEYLENVLSPDQYGFRKGRSTEDQLLLTYDDISSWFDEGLIADLLLLDYSKAFDVVHHVILLSMLQAIGVSGQLLEWISAFLSNRMMQVCVGGVVGDEVPVTSGVPQGSVLGPILFLVYVNHVAEGLQCEHKAFADDYKLYFKFSKKHGSPANGVLLLQQALDRVDLVSRSWNLKLNPEKCVVLRFGRGCLETAAPDPAVSYSLQGVPLKCVNSHKDLGVVVDTSLRFHSHVRTTAQKAGGLASGLLRATVCRSAEFMVSLFVAHIRPLIDYASCVWNMGYLGDSRLLESVQRRWTKEIIGLRDKSYDERLRELQLFSVKGRLQRADLIKCWKIMHGQLDHLRSLFTLAPAVGTRGHPLKLVVPRCATDTRRRFFAVRTVKLWNSLPEHVVLAQTITLFKQLLVEHLGDRMYAFD